MNGKKTPIDLISDLIKSDKTVKLSNISEVIFKSIDVITDNSTEFKVLKNTNEHLYNGVINSLVTSLAVNISIMGMTTEQAINFIRQLDHSQIGGIGIAIQTKIDKRDA